MKTLLLCFTSAAFLGTFWGTAVLRSESAPTEYAVKAAYLYQFGKFVDWPEGSASLAGPVFTICVLGADPFGSVLDETVSGRSVQGKQVLAKRLATAADTADCNVLFLSSSEESRTQDVLRTVQGKSILTVGDSKSFLQQGGMISFQIEQNRVRFAINLAAVERSNLKVSSELLKVATRVKQ